MELVDAQGYVLSNKWKQMQTVVYKIVLLTEVFRHATVVTIKAVLIHQLKQQQQQQKQYKGLWMNYSFREIVILET